MENGRQDDGFDLALADREFETVSNWSRSKQTRAKVLRPSSVSALVAIVKSVAAKGLSVVVRGAGQSYGDAALLDQGIVLDMSDLNRILDWQPDNGTIRLEAGVTIDQLWRSVIESGWWPPVVSGTSFVTIGGAAAMNIHGKNNWCKGTLGEHIVQVEFVTSSGELMVLSRDSRPDLFHAVLGGFGVLGIIATVTMRLQAVSSGDLHVTPFACENLASMFRTFRARSDESDYLVGWVDCFSGGESSGRGLVHAARYIEATGAEQKKGLLVDYQVLPKNFLGILPRELAWIPMQLLFHAGLMRQINKLKYWLGRRSSEISYEQPHVHFAFLLDFFPGWQKAYGPGGMIQYQTFVPDESAERVFAQQLELAREFGVVPFLGVMKRHRMDPFLMTHGLDGFSLALEFKVTRRNRGRLKQLCRELDRRALEAGGRFYFAKDSMLSADLLRDYFNETRVKKFLAIKKDIDPHGLFDSDLFRRIFGSKVTRD